MSGHVKHVPEPAYPDPAACHSATCLVRRSSVGLTIVQKVTCRVRCQCIQLERDVQVCHQNPMGSYCTMGQVGLSMGVYCPCSGAPYPTVRPIPLYHGTGGTVHGSPLSYLRAPYPTVRPIPLYHGTGETVHGSTLSHLRAPYPTVRPIPLYHGTGGTVHGSPLSLLRGSISYCPSYPTVPWDGWDCPWESTVPAQGPHIPLSVLSHCTMGRVGLSMGVHCPI